MPCVLRKRSAASVPVLSTQPIKKRKANTAVTTKPTTKTKKKSTPSPLPLSAKAKEVPSKKTACSGKITVGDNICLEGFGGEIETHDGLKTTFQELVDKSEAGVVLFTYPKASTPGCTTQACLFRDQYAALTTTGFSIYGLSKDSAKANTNFKMKQNLPYPLLCDPSATLITAVGLKKAPSGTTRGVFVVDKLGNVLAAQAGGPAATVDVVKNLVEASSSNKKA